MDLDDIDVTTNSTGILLRCTHCSEDLLNFSQAITLDEVVNEAEALDHECEPIE